MSRKCPRVPVEGLEDVEADHVHVALFPYAQVDPARRLASDRDRELLVGRWVSVARTRGASSPNSARSSSLTDVSVRRALAHSREPRRLLTAS